MAKIRRANNSPRLRSATKWAFSEARRRSSWFWRVPIEEIARMIFEALKRDKYDVLNKLVTGRRRLERSFIRGDIRKEKPTKLHVAATLIIFIIIVFD